MDYADAHEVVYGLMIRYPYLFAENGMCDLLQEVSSTSRQRIVDFWQLGLTKQIEQIQSKLYF